ncbi:hypothetical protein PMIN04_008732 [Paraphaeosphaeria minitans]
MQSQLMSFMSFQPLVAVVVAFPMPDGNDPTQDGKYAKDTGTSPSVLSYVFGGAGCLVIVGVIIFAYCKYKRGKRVLGWQEKPRAKRSRKADVEMNHMPDKRNMDSVYGTVNQYGSPGQALPETQGQAYFLPNLDKPLPRLPMGGNWPCQI